MTRPAKQRPTRRQPPPRRRKPIPTTAPAVTPKQHQAFLQAALFDNCVAELQAMRTRLLAGDCPATITEPERRAAVVDLDRALAQLDNLSHH